MTGRVGSRIVRGWIGLGAAMLVAAIVPTVAMGSKEVGYQYLTTYQGTYAFTQHFRLAPNAPDGLDTTTGYQWVTYDYETILLHPDHSFTRTLTHYVLVRGDARQVDVQGSSFPGGPFTTTTSCQVYSDNTPMEDTSGGPYIQPLLVKSNPAISIGWTLPEPSRQPQFHVTCDNANPISPLPWTPSEPSGTVFTALPASPKMNNAFSGTTTIRYSNIRKKPWTRRFKNVTIAGQASRPGFTGPSTEVAKVTVDSTVTFERIFTTTLPDAKPVEGNKLVSLLISEGFLGLQAQGPAGGPPVGASGDPETVLVPGLGPGELSLDVHGLVLPSPKARGAQSRTARTAADPGVLLASARASVTRGGRPVTLTIVPSAAGHQLLTGPHGALDGRYVLGFRPRGSSTTYHAVEAFSIPATA
ncbi:MAG: hypothetical protein ACRDNK_15430 [Solirubrobacteraceae bacterium]